MGLAEAAGGLGDAARDHPVVAAVWDDLCPCEPNEDPVERGGDREADPRFAVAPDALRVHDVVAFADQRKHVGDGLGWILQVGVDDDHRVGVGVVETGRHRDLVTPIGREPQHLDAVVLRGQLREDLRRAVGTAVVDEDPRVRDAGGLGSGCYRARVELGQHVFLVEARDDDTDSCGHRRHAEGAPGCGSGGSVRTQRSPVPSVVK